MTIEKIWNTIETTLFYYSGNSTSPHLWLQNQATFATFLKSVQFPDKKVPQSEVPIEILKLLGKNDILQKKERNFPTFPACF